MLFPTASYFIPKITLISWKNSNSNYQFTARQNYIKEIDLTPVPTDTTSPDTSSQLKQTDVFIGGQDGTHTYRIPSVVVAPNGELLAFCEARRTTGSDTDDIDLVLKRSADGGATWSDMQVIWDDGPNTCGNPCAVVDQETGTVWLLACHNLVEDHESTIWEGGEQEHPDDLGNQERRFGSIVVLAG